MSDETSALTITLKAGGDFKDPWIVVRGSDPTVVTNMLRNLGELPQAVIETASLLQGSNNAGPLLPQGQPEQAPPAQQAPPQQAWGQAPQQAAPPQQQWAPPPQQPQFQGGGGSNPQAVLHPEGKQCPMDGKVLEQKRTQNGKQKWQCPDWRWNSGNPNGHAMEWAN